MPLVSGVCRTASAPMLSHGGSRLNASKPEANPKTSGRGSGAKQTHEVGRGANRRGRAKRRGRNEAGLGCPREWTLPIHAAMGGETPRKVLEGQAVARSHGRKAGWKLEHSGGQRSAREDPPADENRRGTTAGERPRGRTGNGQTSWRERRTQCLCYLVADTL
jgi:hypothetical protein